MARAIDSVFQREGRAKHQRKADIIEELRADDQRIPLADNMGAIPGEPAIWHAADAAVRECHAILHTLKTEDAILAAICAVCARRGIAKPEGETLEFVTRATDKAWWRRHLRTEWKRRFEHTSIQLGLTAVRADAYVSREIAMMQVAQNAANQKLLEQRTMTNELGQTFSVAEVAARGMGNKTLRKGELMTRVNGFEVIAKELQHVAMFGTMTCPGEFHSVGGTNDKYNGATPRDGQVHLGGVWARYRSWLDRVGIEVYGFRIAEPHTDGCPHWHTLLFFNEEMPGTPGRSAYARATAMMRRYALGKGERKAPKRADIVRRVRAQGRLMDGPVTIAEAKVMADRELHEWRVAERARQNAAPGAKKNRVKVVRIDPEKGSAAGYIIKYVSKNIDGEGVGAHSVTENGETHYMPSYDLFGEVQITPSQRVTYWSQVWGIRQFQQIGGAPVGVWREMRRMKAEAVANAPDAIRAAFLACQKIESEDPDVAKQASWADYLKAQGGPTVGRRAAIKIASREVTIKGRYLTYDAARPVGVYLAAQPDAVYEAVHYRWTIEGAGGVAFDLPRTGVNNCTGPGRNSMWSYTEVIAKMKKNFVRDPWSRSENKGRDDGGQVWSKRADADQVEEFKNRSAKHAEPHLDALRRRYAGRESACS